MTPAEDSTFRNVCVYCGEPDPDSVDHVPPKNLFPPPRPSTLISVPSCSKCNGGFSKDDEYFRAVMVSRHDVGDNPAVKKLFDTVYRGLARPQSVGFKRSFLNAAREFELSTKSGIYLGNSVSFDVDFNRLESTVARTVRGLYYHETKGRLPHECKVNVFLDAGFAEAYVAGDDTVVRLVEAIATGTRREVASDVFRYVYRLVDADKHASGWFLVFYGQIWFIALTHDDIADSEPELDQTPVDQSR